MSQTKNRRKKWLFAVVGVALGLLMGYLALKILGDRLNKSLISEKEYHETVATVTRKEAIKFDQQNHSFINDLGDRVEARPGDEQYRVYFHFDEFKGYEEPFRSQLVSAENKRIIEGSPLFVWKNYNDRSLYDIVQVGDKLIVTYKAYSDSKIDVLDARKSDR
jgi:hypothetical protein